MILDVEVLRRDWQILCIPGLPQGRHQDWLARLSLTTELCPREDPGEADEAGEAAESFPSREVTDVHTYRYLRESFTWTLDDDCQFDQELSELSFEYPDELCTYCTFRRPKS